MVFKYIDTQFGVFTLHLISVSLLQLNYDKAFRPRKGSSTNIIRVRLFKVWRYVGGVYFSSIWLFLGVYKVIPASERDRLIQADSFVEVEGVSV